MNSLPGGTPDWFDDLAAVLHATGPHPGQAEHLNLFGRFVGAWDIDWHGSDDHGHPVRAFAGDDCERAVVEPAARRALSRWDERVCHHDVAIDLSTGGQDNRDSPSPA